MINMEAYDIKHTDSPTEDDIYDHEPENVEYLVYDDGYIEQEPRWTRKRVIWFVIAMAIIVAMVLLLVAPLLQMAISPVPIHMPPPATPPSQL